MLLRVVIWAGPCRKSNESRAKTFVIFPIKKNWGIFQFYSSTWETSQRESVESLFASPDSTFDSSAQQVGQVTFHSLETPHNGLRTFLVAWKLTVDLEDNSGEDISDYIYVQVTDPTGNNTMVRYPTTIIVGGTPDVVPG